MTDITVETTKTISFTFMIKPSDIDMKSAVPIKRTFEGASSTAPNAPQLPSTSKPGWTLILFEYRLASKSPVQVDIALRWSSLTALTSLHKFKSFSVQAATQRILQSRSVYDCHAGILNVEASCPESSHLLGVDGNYVFKITISTETATNSMMPPLGTLFPIEIQRYPCSLDDLSLSITADVQFLWVDSVTSQIHKLYAHLAVLHQHEYFRQKIPRKSSGVKDDLPRKLLVTDFSIPLVRAVLRWIYAPDIDLAISEETHHLKAEDRQHKRLGQERRTNRTLAGDNLPPALACDSCYHPVRGLESLDIHNPRYSWIDVYQIADNFGLEQLAKQALARITDIVDMNSVGVLLSLYGSKYPALQSELLQRQRSLFVPRDRPKVTMLNR